MITVYLVQHGIALSGEEDEARPLSDDGKSEVQKLAEVLSDHGVLVSRVFHSGKLRARQTAELYAQVLKASDVSQLGGLKPNDDPSILIDRLQENHAMYVGHLPHMQKVVSQLIAGDDDASAIKFQNAAVACIEIMEQGGGTLKWFLTPELG